MVRNYVCALAALWGCSSHTAAPQTARDGSPDGAVTTSSAEPGTDGDGGAPAAKKDAKPAWDLTAYIKAHLPAGGTVEAGDPPKIMHVVQAGETPQKIAEAYLEVTNTYRAEELAQQIVKANKNVAPGATITIPNPLTHEIKDPKEERLGWPEDHVIRGVFVTGSYASIKWADIVEKVDDHGLNGIVLDGKDYDGYVNYPSKAKIAIESGAIRANNIPNLARAIRYAHWHNVRVIMRIPCFHDPWTDKHLPGARLSIKYTPTGKPIHVDWLDPTNAEAQDYAIDLAKEALDAGADEIQLDYVRFPVHLTQKVAVLPDKEQRPQIIKDFVHRVHEITKANNAFLSCDFFGVTANGDQDDIERLGQVIPIVAPEADAISLMSYPSHYGKHYMGFENAADHAEIIGIGNKAALEKLKPTGAKTIFRTWLQAFPNGVTHYGAPYLLAQAKSAETSGGVGWLMWSPGCEYSPVWAGWPSKKAAATAAAAPTPAPAPTPTPKP